MDLRNALTDDHAVSPVIGVILMVAVTVILAAVIGTFVLGIGSQVTDDVPRVSAGFVFDDGGDGFGSSDQNDQVTITHRGGNGVQSSALSVTIGGSEVTDSDCFDPALSGEFTAGDSTTIDEAQCSGGSGADLLESGDEVRLIWTNPDGEGSAFLGEEQVP